MQAGKNAMSSVKETATNIASSAASGMEKTKAVLQEKAEKMTAHNPLEKEAAEQRKEERIRMADTEKQDAIQKQAEAREHAHAGHHTGGVATAGSPGVVAGHPVGGGYVEEGVAGSHPIGVATGTTKPSAADDPLAGSTQPVARGTGGRYN